MLSQNSKFSFRINNRFLPTWLEAEKREENCGGYGVEDERSGGESLLFLSSNFRRFLTLRVT